MANIIDITPAAISQLKEALQEEEDPNMGIRIGIRGGGCSGLNYSMDVENNPNRGDFELEFNGIKVYIDPMSAPYLMGTTIDYVSTLSSSGFTFANPQAKRTCGCNKSFSV